MRLRYNSDVTQGHQGVKQSAHYLLTSLTSHNKQHTVEYFNYSLDGKNRYFVELLTGCTDPKLRNRKTISEK